MTGDAMINADNLIEIAPHGQVSGEYISAQQKEILRFEEELIHKGLPILLLVDFSYVTSFAPGAIERAILAANSFGYEKVATFGINRQLTRAIQLINKVLTVRGKTQIFNTREEAVNWLKEVQP